MPFSSATTMHLLCTLAGAPIGFPAQAVREIVPLPMIIPIPIPKRVGAPLVLGAVNLRGQLTPVFDLCAALGQPFFPPSSRDNLVVLESDSRPVCVRVSDVRDVQTLLSRQKFDSGILEGIARSGDQIVRILRVESLFEALQPLPELSQGVTDSSETGALQNSPSDLWAELGEGEREILEARAASLARPLQPVVTGIAVGGGGVKLWAVIRWDNELFGLDLEFVREFAPLRALASVPLSPSHLLGLMNLRGDILPILDLREVTGATSERINLFADSSTEALGEKLAPASFSGGAKTEKPVSGRENDGAPTIIMHIVVIEYGGARLGVWVDEVVDVFAASPAEIQENPLSSREESELLQGTVSFGNRRLGLLDLEKTLEKIGSLELRH